jgi:Ca-activated chloride channel family protein
MSFGAPAALLGLAAIPLLAVWYARRQRGRTAQQAAFVTAPLMASVAPNRPGWRRHAPLVAFVAALAALVFALADPRTIHAETVHSSAIMLACDVSGSMGATDVAPTRLRAAQEAARRLLAAVPARVSVGVMVFDQVPTVLQSPTTDRAADRRALEGWHPHGGTAIGSAIETALAALGRYGTGRGSRPAASIILLSDGGSTSGINPLTAARAAAARHIPVDTVALGTPGGRIRVKLAGHRTATVPVPPEPQLLASIARASRGETFDVRDAGRLDAIYRMLGAKLGHHDVTRTLEAGFAGAALALLALGSALSLRWFGRLL